MFLAPSTSDIVTGRTVRRSERKRAYRRKRSTCIHRFALALWKCQALEYLEAKRPTREAPPPDPLPSWLPLRREGSYMLISRVKLSPRSLISCVLICKPGSHLRHGLPEVAKKKAGDRTFLTFLSATHGPQDARHTQTQPFWAVRNASAAVPCVFGTQCGMEYSTNPGRLSGPDP